MTACLLAWLTTFGSSLQTARAEGVDLEWHPKLAEIHKYSVSVHFDYEGSRLDFTAVLQTRVTEVAGNGSYVLQVKCQNAAASTSEGIQKLEAMAPQRQAFDRRGRPILSPNTQPDPDPFSDLLDHFTTFQAPEAPVRIGDRWLGSTQGLPPGQRMIYRLEAVSKVGAKNLKRISYAVTDAFGESQAQGAVRLDADTNHLVGIEADIPHFRPENAGEEAKVHILLSEIVPPPPKKH